MDIVFYFDSSFFSLFEWHSFSGICIATCRVLYWFCMPCKQFQHAHKTESQRQSIPLTNRLSDNGVVYSHSLFFSLCFASIGTEIQSQLNTVFEQTVFVLVVYKCMYDANGKEKLMTLWIVCLAVSGFGN